MNSRDLALKVLSQWDHNPAIYAQDLLDTAFRTHREFSSEDRAFVYEMVLGVLRRLRLLDHWILQYRKDSIEDELRRILRLGLFQLFFSRVPAHAAVHETVNLAPKRSRGLINAILRKAEREKPKLLKEMETLPLAVRYSLPDFLPTKWEQQWGREAMERLVERSEEVPQHHIRLNRLHPEFDDHRANCVRELTAVNGRDDVYRVETIPSELLVSGAAYLQDPSTLLACELLCPLPGETVLDACASPGGKTAYLAQMMNNQGCIIAVDLTEKRIKRLRENLDRLYVTHVEVRQWDWRERDGEWPMFDRILIDVPCSNTGVIHRRVDVRWRLNEDSIRKMSCEQKRLLRRVIPLLKVGGSVVYSTCSIENEENREVVDEILRMFPQMELIEELKSLPHSSNHDGAYAASLCRTR